MPMSGVREERLKRLVDLRARTRRLIAPLTREQLRTQHSPLQGPIVWDLGHIANFEDQWAVRALLPGRAGISTPAAQDLLYDPLVNPRRVRGGLALPEPAAVFAYMDDVRASTERGLHAARFDTDHPLLADGFVYNLVAQHEAQHAETILQTIQLIVDLEYEPAWRRRVSRSRAPQHGDSVVVPAGPFVMGTDDRALAYDNERPAHVVSLPAYRIDVWPVTNGAYLEFVEDGGYRRPELWCRAGWAFVLEKGIAHPGQWVRHPDGGWSEESLGSPSPLRLESPVVHVSWHEAAAYARWAGKRLPTEAEWEKAAAWDPSAGRSRRYPWGDDEPERDCANLDLQHLAPAAAGAYPSGASAYGCQQMIGDVWEWTASEFRPYPGFVAFPYREYSAVHFDRGYRVLRGGSWATHPVAIRNTFRNWDLPERRQIFAGFRCAADV
jgi:iron(II)-dependent oxidoreductase